MPRTIQADGRTIIVPDDATPDEINQIVRPAPTGGTTPPAIPPDPSGRTPDGTPAPGDTRNGFQRTLDNLVTPDPRREEWQSPVRSGVDDFAQHVASNVLPLISHPIQSGIGMVKSIGRAINNGMNSPTGVGGELLRPLVEKTVEDYQAHGPVRGTTDALGSGLGMLASGEIGGATTGLLGKGLSKLSAPLKRAGLSQGNAVLRAVGPKPFQYGANPARGAFEEGILPSLTRHSAAMKTEAALPVAGERVSNAVTGSTNPIPLPSIASSIESPMNEARGIIEGPGGGGRSVQPIDELQSSMMRPAPGASAPIYGPGAGTRFTPSEAQAALAGRGPRLLPAPTEDIPLGETPYMPGRLSKPTILNSNRAMPREFPSYGVNPPVRIAPELGDIPGEAGPIPEEPQPWGERFNGMKFNQNIGQRSGTFGGGQPPGVLRRPMEFPASDQPTGLADLRHPNATPTDVWRTIQNVDKNTRFNPNPEIEGVNELRRSVRGGLRGNLEDAVPGLKPVTQRYGDLKGVQESLDRSVHSAPSNSVAGALRFPVQGTLGRGLYEASKVAANAAPIARGVGRAGALLQYLRQRGSQQ